MPLNKKTQRIFSLGRLIFLNLLCVSCQTGPNSADVSPANIEIPAMEVKKSETQLVPSKGIIQYNDQPLSGYLVDFHANGNMSQRGVFWKGEKHGISQKWFEDGCLSYEGNFEFGIRSGIVSTWWKNGNQRSESHYVQGKRAGMQRTWRENGKIYSNYEVRNGRVFGLKRANLCYELEDEAIQSSVD